MRYNKLATNNWGFFPVREGMKASDKEKVALGHVM